MSVQVIKKSGEKESFRPNKVKIAVKRSGASDELAERVLSKVKDRLYDGITTTEIYKIAFRILDKEKHALASRYDLKQAIMRLGPAGYSFETYVGEVLRAHGHKTYLRQMLDGECVTHEIDVVSEHAGSSEKCTLIECKYHNREGLRTGIKPTLYTYARYMDLSKGYEKGACEFCFDEVMLATNTQFSDDALSYAKCKGVGLLGWHYPRGEGINDLIDSKKLYPLTILRRINPVAKRSFSDAGIMMLQSLLERNPAEMSARTGIPENKINKFVEEAREIINHPFIEE